MSSHSLTGSKRGANDKLPTHCVQTPVKAPPLRSFIDTDFAVAAYYGEFGLPKV